MQFKCTLKSTQPSCTHVVHASLQVHSLRRTSDASVAQLLPDLQGVQVVGSPGMSPVDGSIFVALSGGEHKSCAQALW